MRIFDRYIIKTFFVSYLTCLIFIIGLLIVIDLFAKVDNFIKAKEEHQIKGAELLGIILEFTLLSIPYVLSKVAPFLTVMAAIFTVTRMCKNNELIPVVMSGTSLYRLLLPVFAIAFAFSGLLIAQQEWLVPVVAKKYNNLKRFISGDELNVLTELDILTDGMGNNFIIHSYHTIEKAITGLEMIKTAAEGSGKSIERIIRARQAQWKEGEEGPGWYLTGGCEDLFGENDAIELRSHVTFLRGTDLTPEEIEIRHEEYENLSFSQLNYLFHRFPYRTHLRILLHSHITDPFANIILLLLGIPFTLQRRNRSIFLGIAICFLIYGAYFGFAFITKDMGNRENLHPLVAAWLPVVFFGSLGICLLDSIKT